MKRILQRFLVLTSMALFLFMGACEDGDKVFDEITTNETRGAILRTVNLISNELPIGQSDGNFSAELEIQDQENGTLVDNVEVYVGFNDNSAEVGPGTNVDESLFETINKSTFTVGEFGLPRFTYSITLPTLLSHVGRTESDITGGDQFTIRFELVLSDGRRYSAKDNSGTLTGSYFSSPFQYNPTVICPIDADQFVGTYVIEQLVPGIFSSNTWGNGTEVEVTVGETSTQRKFSAVYLPDFGIGNGPREFVFDLICGSIDVPAGQGSGLQCSAGISFGPPVDADKGTYDISDDSVFTITFRDDETDDCGGGIDAQVRLTKL